MREGEAVREGPLGARAACRAPRGHTRAVCPRASAPGAGQQAWAGSTQLPFSAMVRLWNAFGLSVPLPEVK